MSNTIQVNVALPNGHSELLSLFPSSTVRDVKTKAQQAFGKKYLRLVTAKNRVLAAPDKTLAEAEIEDGECLTALVLQPQLAATSTAFALCHGDATVVTWGDPLSGGNSSAVRDQLRGVHQIQATARAFAAILEDASVVTWGEAGYGADSSSVRDQLKGVRQIQATFRAFAAILADGSVVTWGHPKYGADSSLVRDQLLKGVQQIQATANSFAAILADGSVVTWGAASCGGDSSAVRDQLRGVQQIRATRHAFAAILADGSVVTWGAASCGGDSSAVRDQLRVVQQIQATDRSFAAILPDGSDSLHVEPNVFATAALAKAHFMAGRLRYAEELLASEAQGKTMSQRLCNEYLQILLILCHAAPTPANFQKTSDFIQSKAKVRRDGVAETEWSKMTSLLQQMKPMESAVSKPLRLHHILVTKNSQRSTLMYHWGFMKATHNVLRAVCYNCSKLLADPKDLKMVNAMKIINRKKRLQAVMLCCRAKRVCNVKEEVPDAGGEGVQLKGGCGHVQPRYFIDTTELFQSFPEIEGEQTTGVDRKRKMPAEEAKMIFERISDEDCIRMGFDPKFNHPKQLILSHLPIPPPHATEIGAP
eukprot:symbB.v1.2.022655.t1/scaffold2027.1/size138498/3